uniref:Uncharacterized protein n=1 Tax=Anguilla anguilla TaxID=7936 RepID=A0A0E9R7Q5_ANGAN
MQAPLFLFRAEAPGLQPVFIACV